MTVVRSFSSFSIAAPLQPLDKPAEQPHEPEDRRHQNSWNENIARLVAADELSEAIIVNHFELSSHSDLLEPVARPDADHRAKSPDGILRQVRLPLVVDEGRYSGLADVRGLSRLPDGQAALSHQLSVPLPVYGITPPMQC